MSFVKFPCDRGKSLSIDAEKVVAVYDDIYGARVMFSDGGHVIVRDAYASEVTTKIEQTRAADEAKRRADA